MHDAELDGGLRIHRYNGLSRPLREEALLPFPECRTESLSSVVFPNASSANRKVQSIPLMRFYGLVVSFWSSALCAHQLAYGVFLTR